MRFYGTGGWGSDWNLQQCNLTAPVAVGLTGNCSSAMLRHRWLGFCLETGALRYYGTGECESDWKLQKCNFTSPVAGGLNGNCRSAMLRHRWLGAELKL